MSYQLPAMQWVGTDDLDAVDRFNEGLRRQAR